MLSTGHLFWRTCMVLAAVTVAAASDINCSTSSFDFFPPNTVNIPGGWNKANQTKAGNDCDGYLLPIAIQGIPKPLLHFVPKHGLLLLGGDVPVEYVPSPQQLAAMQNRTTAAAAVAQLASSQSQLLEQVLSEVESSNQKQQQQQSQSQPPPQLKQVASQQQVLANHVQALETPQLQQQVSLPQLWVPQAVVDNGALQQQMGERQLSLEAGEQQQQQQQQQQLIEGQPALQQQRLMLDSQLLQQQSSMQQLEPDQQGMDTIQIAPPRGIIRNISGKLQLLQQQRQQQEVEKELQAIADFMQRRLLGIDDSLQYINSITDLLPSPGSTAAAAGSEDSQAATSAKLPADLLPSAAVNAAAGSKPSSAPKAATGEDLPADLLHNLASVATAAGSQSGNAPKAATGTSSSADLLPSPAVVAAGRKPSSAARAATSMQLPTDLLPSVAVTAAAGTTRIAMLNAAGIAQPHQPDVQDTLAVQATSKSSRTAATVLSPQVSSTASRLRTASSAKVAGKLMVDGGPATWTVAVPAQYNFSVTVNGRLWFRSQTFRGYNSVPVVNFNANITEGRRDVFDPETFREGINTVVINVTVLQGSAVITDGHNSSLAPSHDETFSSPPIDFYFFMTSNETHDSRPSADVKVNNCKPEVSFQLTNTSPPPVLLDGFRLTYTPSSTTQAFFLPVYFAYGTFTEGLDGTTDLQSDGTEGNVKNFGVYITRLPGSPDDFNVTVPNLSLLKEGWYDFTVEGAIWSPNSHFDNLMSVAGIDKFGNKLADYLSVTAGGNVTDSISLYGGFKGAGWVLPDHNQTRVGIQRRPTWLDYFTGPETAITLGQRATFSWEFSGLGNASCKVNGVDPGMCTSPITYPILTTLNQTLEVTYHDVCDKTHTVSMTFGTFGWEVNDSTFARELDHNGLLALADSDDLEARRTAAGTARRRSNSADWFACQGLRVQLLVSALATVLALLL